MSGQIAQLVEHRTENPGVGGSIPPLPINENKGFPKKSETLCSLNTAIHTAILILTAFRRQAGTDWPLPP